MASCGLWVSRATLWASVVDGDGKHLHSFPAARTDGARQNLLAHLKAHQNDCELVITDAQARLDNIANLALQRNVTVWLASWRAVDAMRAVAGLVTPKRTAIAIARMPKHPHFRSQLRRLERDERQLSLL
jgi:hypothetical protein